MGKWSSKETWKDRFLILIVAPIVFGAIILLIIFQLFVEPLIDEFREWRK